MLFVGIVGSAILGITQGKSTRLVPGSHAAFVGSRLGMFYGALYGFAVLWLIVFRFTLLQTGLFWVTIVMFGSIVAGIWLSQAMSVGLYVGITLVTVLGYFLFPHYFWVWTAVFAGLPLVGMGIYYLRKELLMATLNEVIHQPARLRIMAVLAGFAPEIQVTFNYLKDALDLTDGNLGAHLHKLEEAGYVTITKAFVRNKPQTYAEVTETGRQAFAEHSAALTRNSGE